MYLPVPNSNDPARSPSARSSGTKTTPVTPASGIKLEALHPVLAQDLKDYSKGQPPSMQSFTDGSRNTSPTPSSTATASSGSGSSRTSHTYFPTPPAMYPSGTAPARQGGEGYYPNPPSRQREGYGVSQQAPLAYAQPSLQPHHQHQPYQNQGHYAQRSPHQGHPHTTVRHEAGAGPAYPERKFATLSCPTIPGNDPTIEGLDVGWQSMLEQVGF